MKTRLIIDWNSYREWYSQEFGSWDVDENEPIYKYHNQIECDPDETAVEQGIYLWAIDNKFILGQEEIETI